MFRSLNALKFTDENIENVREKIYTYASITNHT